MSTIGSDSSKSGFDAANSALKDESQLSTSIATEFQEQQRELAKLSKEADIARENIAKLSFQGRDTMAPAPTDEHKSKYHK